MAGYKNGTSTGRLYQRLGSAAGTERERIGNDRNDQFVHIVKMWSDVVGQPIIAFPVAAQKSFSGLRNASYSW